MHNIDICFIILQNKQCECNNWPRTFLHLSLKTIQIWWPTIPKYVLYCNVLFVDFKKSSKCSYFFFFWEGDEGHEGDISLIVHTGYTVLMKTENSHTRVMRSTSIPTWTTEEGILFKFSTVLIWKIMLDCSVNYVARLTDIWFTGILIHLIKLAQYNVGNDAI